MSTDVPYTFPFGQPVKPVTGGAPGNRDCLVLGSSPSALCMRWRVPGGKLVQGFAIDNEPSPFWDGHDQDAQIRVWKDRVCWQPTWGETGPTRQNGLRGQWVGQQVLSPLGISRDRVCAATLVETYYANEATRHRIDEHYRPLIERLGLSATTLPNQLANSDLAREAVTTERDRLLGLLRAPSIRTVITLGTATWKAVAELFGPAAAQMPASLLGDGPAYGQAQSIAVDGREVRWIAFVSPSAPASMQRVHAAWMTRQGVKQPILLGSFK